MSILENRTSFNEEIEVDEKQEVEVFRVPAHNNVNAADFYLDFKMVSLVSITCPTRDILYIAKWKHPLGYLLQLYACAFNYAKKIYTFRA